MSTSINDIYYSLHALNAQRKIQYKVLTLRKSGELIELNSESILDFYNNI